MFACAAVATAAPLTLTWNGGGSGNLSDSSWSGGEEGHLTPQNGDALVFPKGGSFINDIDGLKVSALTFTSSAAVALAGEKVITVMGGGKVHTSGAGAVSISAPLQMGDGADAVAQGEDDLINPPAPVIIDAAGSGKKITISGVISGSAPIAVGTASGTVEFTGNNTFTGKLSVTNGLFNATGKNALGAGEEEILFKTGNGNGRAKICLNGITANKPIRNVPGNLAQEVTFAGACTFNKEFFVTSDSSPQWMVNSWATVVFNDKLTVQKDWQGSISTGGKIELKGEGSSIRGFIMSIHGNSTYYNENKPNNQGTIIVHKPLTLTTDTDWSSFCPTFIVDYGIMKMMVADAFPHAKYGWNPLRFNKKNDGSIPEYCFFDMNGYSQTFTCIRDDAKSSSNVIKSDSKDCVLRLMQNWSQVKPGTSQVASVFHGEIRGKVSVSVEGSDSCYFAGPNTSTGSFSLTNQAYCGFTSTGVWKGTNFFVSAGSTLVVSNTAALPVKSQIRLSDAPDQEVKSSVLLGEGNYTATSMLVDGELLYRGTWGSSESNARFKDDVHFKGPGVLTLKTGAPVPGCRIIIK